MTFSRYFQDELVYLRQAGSEFARAYPALAPMLAEQGGDPEVSRLLEGLAFLTARVRQRIDDDLPEVAQSIAQLLFPQLARPLPSATILELTPLPNVLRERVVVRAGTEFDSIPVEGTPCRFTSTAPCELLPWAVTDARLEARGGGKAQLRITLRSTTGAPLSSLDVRKARFHVAGELRSSFALLAALLQHATSVTLVDPAGGPDARSVVMGPGVVRAVGFDAEEALLPDSSGIFPGFRLLTELHALPARFAFFEVVALERIRELDPKLVQVAIVVDFDGPLSPDVRVAPDTLRLHCVPVVNVFSTTAEPIRVEPTTLDYRVRPAALTPEHGEVYAVRGVQAILRSSAQRLQVRPFYGASSPEGAQPDVPGRALAYATRTVPGLLDRVTETMLTLVGGELATELDVETLSLDLLATNRDLPSALRPGDVCRPTPSSPPFASFKNISPVTTHVATPLGRELQWRAIAHAAMNLRAATDVDVLRTLLEVYDLPALVDRQAARARDLRAASLLDISVAPSERLYRGAPVRGVDVRLRVDERGFRGDGEIFLFGAVVEQFFAQYVGINSYARTTIEGATTKVSFQWPARSGSTTLP